MNTTPTCQICASSMRLHFSHQVMFKYDVDYFICGYCGAIQTEKPYWLHEAYGSAIAPQDIGLLDRNIRTRRYLEPLIELLGIGQGKFLDIGGGYGTLTRLMRDIGYDCYTHDPYCENIFAVRFAGRTDSTYDALFAFEVLEHCHDPISFLNQYLGHKSEDTLIFSTLTYKSVPEETWWYYAFESGQHVTFYQEKTLAVMAEKLGLNYYSVTQSIHIITARRVSIFKLFLLKNRWLFWLVALFTRLSRRKKSLILDDHEFVKSPAANAERDNKI